MSTEKYKAHYIDMIGMVPPKVAQRLDFSVDVDPEGLDRIETLRKDILLSNTIDQKHIQLMAFAVLLTQTSAAAEFHGRAAIRAGATKEQLYDAAKVAFLFRGLAAINHAGEILTKIYAQDDE